MLNREIQGVLRRRPLGLVFDIDGTLSSYVPYPQKAQLYPGVGRLLEQCRKYAHVAILTSRAIENVAAMVNVDGLTYIGTYGAEWSEGLPGKNRNVQVLPEAQPYIEPSKRLLDLVEQQLPALPGLVLERKRLGGTIHYYHSPHPEQARQKIFSLLEAPVREAHMHFGQENWTVEIKPPIAEEKGMALRRYIQQYQLQAIIFAGDDLPDLTAFLEIARFRKEGGDGLSILVQHEHTPSVLLENADLVVQEVEGMVELLREMVYCLQKQG